MQRSAVPAVSAVTVEDDTIVVLPATAHTEVHSLMDRIARLETVTTDRFVYRLDPQAAYEAFEGGTALSQISEAWDQLVTTPMPTTIRGRLAAWWEAYGQVRIYDEVTVVEFSDDYALAEMKAVTSLDEVMVAEISPRLVIVPRDAVDTLMAELEAAGYTPQLTDEA
jgi:hypothetical protein